MARFIFLLPLLVFCTSLAAQQPRNALVIGNGNYEFASLGQTPANDANAVRDALILAGFEVDYFTNLDQNKLSNAISAFGRKIKDSGGVALFYYSGHGVQYNNQNFIVPIGAEMTDEEDIEGLCIPISRITARMLNAGTTINLVVLDACRTLRLKREGKSLTKGLVKEDYPVPELLVAYATGPGSTATVRGEKGLSLFTSQLLKHLKTPGLVLETVLKNTRRDVLAKSNGKQRPDETGNLTSDFYFFAPSQHSANPDKEVVVPRAEEITAKKTNTESPRGADSDLDGTPDATDPCPNEYGTLAAGGCPDNDEDGVPNKSDKCPKLPGKKAWQGCPDSDGDGLPDHTDACPDVKGTLSHDGCPAFDQPIGGSQKPEIKNSSKVLLYKEHIVRQGETLRSIATKYKIDPAELAQVNGLEIGEAPTPGKLILIPIDEEGSQKPERKNSSKVPQYKEHMVRQGETLRSIAAKYRVNEAELAQINGLKIGETPTPGRWFLIPIDEE